MSQFEQAPVPLGAWETVEFPNGVSDFKALAATGSGLGNHEQIKFYTTGTTAEYICGVNGACSGVITRIGDSLHVIWTTNAGKRVGSSRYNAPEDTMTINDVNARLDNPKFFTSTADFGGTITSSSTLVQIFNAMPSYSILFISPNYGGFGTYTTLGVKCNGVVVLFKWSASRHLGLNYYSTASNLTSHEAWYFRIAQSDSTVGRYDTIIWSQNYEAPTYSQLSLSNGNTGAVHIIRNGKSRVICGFATTATTGASGTVLSTLDSGDRPPVDIYAPCSSYGTQIQSEMKIGTDGKINLYVPSGGNSNSIKFNISYCVS